MNSRFADALFEKIDAGQESLASICRRAGVSYEKFKKLNQTRKQTGVDDAAKIANAVGLSIDQVMGINAQAAPPPEDILKRAVRVVFRAIPRKDIARMEPDQIAALIHTACEALDDRKMNEYAAGNVVFFEARKSKTV